MNGKYYYVINGKLETGWRMIDNEWYFFQNDYSAAVGNDVNIDGYYYGFDDTGVLVSGSWADTDKGRQYMWAGYSVKKQFREIDGKTYAFDVNGYLYIGSQYIRYTQDVYKRQMLSIAEALRKNGADVRTYSPRELNRSEPDIPMHTYYGTYLGRKLHNLFGRVTGLNGLGSIIDTIGLVRMLRKNGTDVLHLHNLHSYCINFPRCV